MKEIFAPEKTAFRAFKLDEQLTEHGGFLRTVLNGRNRMTPRRIVVGSGIDFMGSSIKYAECLLLTTNQVTVYLKESPVTKLELTLHPWDV